MLQFMDLLRSRRTVYCFSSVPKKLFSSVERGIMEFDETNQKSSQRIQRYRVKNEYQKNFVENLFLGIFEPKVLEYPQIRTMKEVDYLMDHKKKVGDLLKSIDYKQMGEVGKIPEDLLKSLKQKEVLGMKIKVNDDEGLGYLESESSFIQESLSLNASLSKTVAQLENFGYQIINLFGNSSQKEIYLPKFLNDKCNACLAHLENHYWVPLDSMPLSTTAVKLPDNINYAITGHKTTVYNPSGADFIIVSAKTNEKSNKEGLEEFTMFIVDKNSEGVKVLAPLEKIGLKGVEICEVAFDNVIVPKDNIIGSLNQGNLIVQNLLASGKLCNGPQCIGLMKKMVNDMIEKSIHKVHFNKPLRKYKYVQSKIGELVNALYAVESMTYLMTGRVDTCDYIDVMLESLIIKIFASESVNFCMQNYVQFMGKEEANDVEFMENLLRDSYFFSAFDDPNGYLKVLLGTIGVKYVLRQLENRTEKYFKPKSSIELRYREFLNEVKAPRILRGYLHLTLEEESIGLEFCVGYLGFWTQNLIRKYGSKLLDKTYELAQLGDLVIIIYKLAAVLGRASRSYCIGNRNSANEVLIARNIHQNSYMRFLLLKENILRYTKRGINFNEVGRYALESKLSTIHPAGFLRSIVRESTVQPKLSKES